MTMHHFETEKRSLNKFQHLQSFPEKRCEETMTPKLFRERKKKRFRLKETKARENPLINVAEKCVAYSSAHFSPQF